MKQVLGALKAIAGNDDVKDAAVNAGGAELIVMAMNRHSANAQVCPLTELQHQNLSATLL